MKAVMWLTWTTATTCAGEAVQRSRVFTVFEPALGINLPDEVVDYPAFKEISIINLDVYCWSHVNCSHIPWATSGARTNSGILSHQDLYSFNMERSRGIDAANIITILMKYKGYAIQWAADHVVETFLTRSAPCSS